MLKNKLVGDIEEIYAYFEKISPCIDCRYCWQEKGCAIKDTMDKFYKYLKSQFATSKFHTHYL